MNDVGMLDTSIWTGYIVWPKGDMRLHACRVYKTLQEASDAAQERADSHHRPYEVRVVWRYAATHEYLFADYNGNHKKTLRQARRDARKLAGIFNCTNHDTNEKGMWQ